MHSSILLIASLICLAGLGVGHKVADYVRCKPGAINMMLFFWAGGVLWIYTFFYKVLFAHVSLFPPFTFKAAGLAAVCGLLASIAILTFQIGVRYGRIATSWLVINLSAGVPAVLSFIIYQEWKEKISWQLPVGLLLILASVLLLWRDKVEEIARGEQPVPQWEAAPPQLGEKELSQ